MKAVRALFRASCVFALTGIALNAAETYHLEIPRGLDEFVPIPEDNPVTHEKVQLGKRLFFDRGLSRDGTVSCGTCHPPIHMFTNRQPVGIGVEGRAGRRNVPSLFNRAYQRTFSWDGRETSLERQVLRPFQDPLEMDLTLEELERRLDEMPKATRTAPTSDGQAESSVAWSRGVPAAVFVQNATRASHPQQESSPDGVEFAEISYRAEFQAAFGEPPNAMNAAKALASYLQVLIYADSAFDRFQRGDLAALSEPAQRGLKLFRGRANCTACHSGPLLSDEEFHNTGVGWGRPPLDLGRFEVTSREGDRGRFKTPGLREVALTPPYMHDGSLATLADVLDFYSHGGNPNPHLDREIRPLNLTAEEKADLVEFLKALSGNP